MTKEIRDLVSIRIEKKRQEANVTMWKLREDPSACETHTDHLPLETLVTTVLSFNGDNRHCWKAWKKDRSEGYGLRWTGHCRLFPLQNIVWYVNTRDKSPVSWGPWNSVSQKHLWVTKPCRW